MPLKKTVGLSLVLEISASSLTDTIGLKISTPGIEIPVNETISTDTLFFVKVSISSSLNIRPGTALAVKLKVDVSIKVSLRPKLYAAEVALDIEVIYRKI